MSFVGYEGQVTMTVTALPNTNHESVAAVEQDGIAYSESAGNLVTYKRTKGNDFTLTGFDSSHTKVFYDHLVVDSQFEYQLLWSYPTSMKSIVDPMVNLSEHSFVPGPNTDAGA